jgi:hypothetical protein
MLPNFTVVICGAVLTVLMLAVAGSGLIDPQVRTRIGAMPEIGRPMMQRMITEPAARGQFAALEASRRADELMRLRDLAPAIAEPAPSAEHDDSNQPAVQSAAPATQPPSDTPTPATSAEAEPPAIAESAPAAPTVPSTDAVSVAIAEAPPPTEAEAPPPNTAGAPAPEATTLAVEAAETTLVVVPTEPSVVPRPVASPIEPATATESVATAPPSEAPPVAELGNPPAEPPTSAPQQLALAEPDAVPAPEPPAKLAARTGEPEEPEPVRRWVPRFVPRLPRIVPALSRVLPPRLAHAPTRVTPILVRHVHVKARAEAAKPDVAKVAVAPKKLVRHWVRQVPHRAQRALIAPNTAIGPYPAYSGTPAVQYR